MFSEHVLLSWHDALVREGNKDLILMDHVNALLRHMRQRLPEGRSLPQEVWQRRRRSILWGDAIKLPWTWIVRYRALITPHAVSS
jgi:hypothetical protein